MGGLGLLFRRRAIQANPVAGSSYILSETKGDAEVFRILMEKGVSADGVGITADDLARLTNIATWFRNNSLIVNFVELAKTGVTTLAQYAFQGCTSLEDIDTSNILTINGATFSGCSALTTEISLDQVSAIPGSVFQNSAIIGISAKKATSVGGYAFDGCKGLLKADLQNATFIDLYSFRNCSALTDVNMPNVVTINGSAFQNTAIRGFLMLSALKTLGGSAFNTSKIDGIDAPSAESIGAYAFSSCSNLKIAKLPSAKSFGNNAFMSCSNLAAMVLGATPPTLGSAVFSNTNNCLFYVPDAFVDTYKGASGWSSLSARIKPLSEYSE